MESWSKDVPIDMLKEELLFKMVEQTGTNKPEYRQVLKLLAHPDLIKASLAYLQALDADAKCRRYDPPWSCIRDSEARYENTKNGWAGAGSFLENYIHEQVEWWCDSCRRRVMDA